MTAILFGSISSLADTSELQREAFNTAFATHGLDWSWDRDDYRRQLTSNGGADRVAEYARRRGEEVDAAAVHATKSQLFQQALGTSRVEARPGVAETVEQARAGGLKVGLVTTTSRDNLDALAAALDGQVDLGAFDVVVSADDVTATKPEPDAYAFALQRLGESAADCVAVEDNVGGVASAHAAGVPVVAFPNENTGEHDFGEADARVERVDLDALRELLGRSA